MRAVVLVTTLCVAAIALEATPSAGAMTFLPQSKGAISISSQNRARNHQGGGPNQAKAEGSFSRPSRLAKLGKARTATASAGSHANDATVQVGDAPPLEEVVVTADRRTEKIQDVPISVTALSGAELRNLSAQSFSDNAQAVPGLSFASGGPGLNRIAIRGVSSSGGSSATVGYYIDDTPISDIKYNPDLDLIDLQRIEVLRGPQGTLYGSGSMGGTIRLITNKPKLNAWSAQLTASLADTANGGLDTEEDAVLNAPIAANVAALRLAVFWRHTDGFINRVKPLADDPMVADPKSPVERAVNSFQSAGFRLGVDFQPVTDLTINPSVFYQRFTLANPQTVDVPPASGSELVQLRISSEPEFDSLTLGSLAIRYSPGAVQLISTTSLYRRHQTDVEDASRFIYFVFYPQQSYLLPTTDTEDRRTDSFTQEIRVESRTAQRFQWLVGLFYTKIKVPFGVFQPAYGFNEAFNLGIPNEVIFGENRRIDTRESAVYGQTSYSLSHGVRLIAGARISWDRQAFTDTQSGLFGSDATTAGSSAERSVNPKYEISYQPRRNLLTYVNAARGFRLGGPITPPPVPLCSGDLQAIDLSAPPTQYKADHLWSYETGAKTSWFEQRLRVNGSAYYIDWQDIQQNITLKNCGYNFTGNAGAAVSKGGELEVQTSSPSGVSTGASVSYTDAYITRAAPGTGVIPGQPVLETPRWNLTGSVGYQREIADRYEGFVFLETMYTSHDYTYFVVTDPAHRRSGYSLTNLRCGVQGDHWGAAFFVRNVFNRFAILQYPTPLTADVPYYRRASIETPRTVGVSVHVTF